MGMKPAMKMNGDPMPMPLIAGRMPSVAARL